MTGGVVFKQAKNPQKMTGSHISGLKACGVKSLSWKKNITRRERRRAFGVTLPILFSKRRPGVTGVA